ncbi:hypothetical protein CWB99_20850 [Pseudoalteromonas rubra]|uniref:Uncharacterized protein n=1 Tax=Pseudoalteromonas rubra TaxID=43658 RepID=A0A5S3WGN6_9GAMM|nr:hypothetical protein [Pseudoalteromonas rubra]TMP25618.1 hypothetical protein CWB99_20850 [Pseudoalteromonas rubra]TMP30969.1 hypothetical protein CWC00_15285 [Pseudoalteromonas rubra]
MDKFLVNMAVVKVNWDESQGDILDNYIPLIAYTLGQMKGDIVSIEEFKVKFQESVDFTIPTGAIITLLKRAARKHKYLKSSDQGTFNIDKGKIDNNDFVQKRDSEQRKFNQLKEKFIKYCKENLNVDINKEEADEYFFDVLFEISPQLFSSVSNIENIKVEVSEQKKYLVSSFISHVNKADQTSFESIISFVRGAMLTETFFYSHPSEIKNKMRKVQVFFDTQFLLRALGYADSAIVTPCKELIEMLSTMSVKMHCFKHTYDEIHKILYAAASRLRQHGRLKSSRPGDVFDYFNRLNWSTSDVELELAKLERNLNDIGVFIEDKPPHNEKHSIDEKKLAEEIQKEIPNQSEESRNHDIDCLASIFRLRCGKKQDYLESCIAIFITTNAAISRASTSFFNKEYGASNASICMADQVFTTLIWLKTVKKAPDMPKDRLVATCYAATRPSEKLWDKYVAEAERLKEKGSIKEEDFAVLIHSLEARNRLMYLTLGENEIVQGTVEDVLNTAKQHYINDITKELHDEKEKNDCQIKRIISFSNKIGEITKTTAYYSLLLLWTSLLAFGLLETSPKSIVFNELLTLNSVIFITLTIITIFNLLFGFKVMALCKEISIKFGNKASDYIEKKLKA